MSLINQTNNNSNPLNCKWVLWYHDNNSDDWTINGYKKILELETVEDFWLIFNKIRDFSIGMFFLMRNGCLPIWESYNGNIHFIKYRSYIRTYQYQWLNLCKASIGEIITDNPSEIVGVSISPKMKTIIMRIWITTDKIPNFIPDVEIPLDKCLFE